MNENKERFVQMLSEALTTVTDEVRRLEYNRDADGFEAVTLIFQGGSKHTINVTGRNYAYILNEIGFILSR